MARQKPKRSDFPRGLLGNRKFQLAMEAYNKATNPPKPKPKSSTKRPNRAERRSGSSASKSQPPKRGMSNIPKSEGTGGAAEKALGYGAGKPKGNGGSSGGSSGSSRRPAPKPATKSNAAAVKGFQKDLAEIKKVERQAAAQKASKERKQKLLKIQEAEKKKSIAKGKANRSRRNTTARGPRDRY